MSDAFNKKDPVHVIGAVLAVILLVALVTLGIRGCMIREAF